MALGNANIGSTQTALTDPSSLTAGSQGQSDLGNLLLSDDQIASSGNSGINTGALNGAINSDYGSATSAVDSVSGATGGSIGSDLGSILSSIGGSDLGSLAAYGGVYALLANQASNTETQNNALAGQIEGIGQPLVTQGQGLTSAFSQGQLTSPYQQQVTAAEAANQNTATSQGQQVARLLANSGGGQNVQGAQASESQQITNAQTQANTAAISQAFQNELSSGIGLVGAGGGFVQSGIQQEISSNTALQGQLASLMGTLAQAYARQSSGSGGTGTGSTATGSLGSILGKLLGGGGSVSPGSLTSAINSDTASNISGLQSSNSGFNIENSDASNFGNFDSELNANTNSYLNSTDGLNNASISLGDLTASESDLGGVADDIGDFSAGSAAAGATLGSTAANLSDADIAGGIPSTDFSEVNSNIPSANLGSAGSVLGGLGGVGSIYSAIENPSNPATGIQAAGGAAKLANAGLSAAGEGSSGALSTIAQYAGPVAAAAGLLYGDYEMIDSPNTPDALRSLPAGGSIGKLPSGNSILEDNGIGIGLGTQQTQGSGEIYQVGANGQPQWIGQADSGKLESDYDTYEQALKGYTVGQTTASAPKTSTVNSGILQNVPVSTTAVNPSGGLGAQSAAATTKVPETAAQIAQQKQAATSSMASIFASTGGAAKWGVSEADWLSTMMSVLGSVSPGTEWART